MPDTIMRRPLAGGPATAVVSGTSAAPLSGAFTMRAGEIFFIELGPPYPTVFRIVRSPVSGGARSTIAEFVNRSFPPPGGLRASDAEVMWADADRIVALSIADGSERTALSAPGPVLEFVIEGTHLIASVASSALVRAPAALLRVPLAGGTPGTLAAGLERTGGLQVDGADLYWFESPIYDQFEGPGRVARLPLTGGAPETVFMGVAPLPRISMGEGQVFIGDKSRIKAVGADGRRLTQLLHSEDGIVDLAYAAYGGGSVYALVGPLAEVIRLPAGGGAPSVLVPGSRGPGGALRVSGGFVFWINSIDEVWRVSEGGGDAQRIAAGLAAAVDLATDGEHVFVYENDGARIIRIPASGGPVEPLAGANYGVPTRLALDGD